MDAYRMIDAFASVGVPAAMLTFTDIDQQKRAYRPTQDLAGIKRALPHLMRRAEQQQWSLIVRPRMPEHAPVLLVQLDDVSPLTLERLKDVAFMTVRTSPRSNQAWIAVTGAGPEIERRLKRAVHCDKHASGAVRLAGTRNVKHAYAPDFPTVTLLSVTPGRTVTPEQLERMGLLPPEINRTTNSYSWVNRLTGQRKEWPDYAHFQQMNGDDRSRADYFWCMTAIRRGHGIEETAAELMTRSAKAKEKQHGWKYALRTAESAARALACHRQVG